MADSPSPNGSDGRDSTGRFRKGNSGGPGNPLAKRTAALRSVILNTVTENDLREIILKMVERAKAGDLAACRELLDRLIGKPKSGAAIDFDDPPEYPRPMAEVIAEIRAVLGQEPTG